MTVRDIQYAIIRQRRGLMAINTVPLRWRECDVLEVTGSLLWHEFEVKVSRADYTADFRKKLRSRNGTAFKHDLLQDKSGRGPNYFSFAVTEGLIPIELVPKYAGLFEMSNGMIRMRKKPVRLHNVKFDGERLFNIACKRNPAYDVKAVWDRPVPEISAA